MKHRILFVDDEENILSGLKRLLFSMRKEWEQYFAIGAIEALKLLETTEVDVIVTDIKMPEMNGAELLEEVMKRYPKLIRIVLSGHSDEEMALKSAKAAHQFLAKPFDSDSLKSKIKKTIYLQNLVNNKELVHLIHSINQLPTMPDLYLKLENEINSENTSLSTIASIIESDIMMSAKILQLSNSAFFGISNNVKNIIEAVNLLGFNIIKSLVIYTKVFSNSSYSESHINFLDNIWKHSIKVAKLSKSIMQLENNNPKLVENAFVAGLLHDIGKLVLLSIAINKGNDSKEELLMIGDIIFENENYNTTHAELGAYLLGVWGLDDQVIEGIAYHHCPEKSISSEFKIQSAVYFANYFVNHNTFPMPGENSPKTIHNIEEIFELCKSEV